VIIHALDRYYDILTQDEKSGIPAIGYSIAKVAYALTISTEGELLGVISLMEPGSKGNKVFPREMPVPEQAKRSVNISPNFMCDNSTYVLGIDEKGNPERTKRAYLAFKELHQALLANAQGQAAKAVLRFLENWDVGSAATNLILVDYLQDILKGSNLVFRLDGHTGFLHDDPEIRQLWELHTSTTEGDVFGQCLVTGKQAPIAVLHPSIKKVKGAKSTGASLVSFNAPAYESYGKSQSLNSPTSKKVAFAYTTVLNHMLSSQKQTIQVGDATTVFWAESAEEVYTDIASLLFNPVPESVPAANQDPVRDVRAENIIRDVLHRVKSGQKIGNLDGAIDIRTKFYILGLAPNASRLSVRFFHADSFGGFLEKTAQHYRDMEIVKDYDNQPSNIPIWRMLAETVSAKSRDRDPKPLLAGAVMRSIISGAPYPASLFNAIMIRVRADMDDKEKNIQRINYIRAAMIKAYLLRYARLHNNNNLEGVLTVGLNEQTDNTEYLLGRLFAILEKAQQDANPGINATIKDRYFASACATPGAVFPVLLRLAQHHISKSDYGAHIERRLDPIMSGIEKFPTHLTLEQQGTFILGYYHQRVALYQKANTEQNGGDK
jgi:CRISPR-associated protein Csd1